MLNWPPATGHRRLTTDDQRRTTGHCPSLLFRRLEVVLRGPLQSLWIEWLAHHLELPVIFLAPHAERFVEFREHAEYLRRLPFRVKHHLQVYLLPQLGDVRLPLCEHEDQESDEERLDGGEAGEQREGVRIPRLYTRQWHGVEHDPAPVQHYLPDEEVRVGEHVRDGRESVMERRLTTDRLRPNVHHLALPLFGRSGTTSGTWTDRSHTFTRSLAMHGPSDDRTQAARPERATDRCLQRGTGRAGRLRGGMA